MLSEAVEPIILQMRSSTIKTEAITFKSRSIIETIKKRERTCWELEKARGVALK